MNRGRSMVKEDSRVKEKNASVVEAEGEGRR